MNELQLKDSGESQAAEENITAASVIEADDLVEEVSIDGMCGVY